MKPLAGRNCLITGASRGLGATIAHTFWEKGANLLLIARSASGLANVVGMLPPRDGQQVVHTVVADLSDPDAPEHVFRQEQGVFGGMLHVLVNNAATQGPIGPIWENDWDEWQQTIQVNLLSPVALCRLCVPYMSYTGLIKKIINLSGGGATGPRANFSAYAVAKTGLVRFSETLAEEVRPYNIDVNCVAPGTMGTMGVVDGEVAHRQHARLRAAELCAFLASSKSDGITGKIISAVWDDWEKLPKHLDALQTTDMYTLRRIVPKDRNMDWGE